MGGAMVLLYANRPCYNLAALALAPPGAGWMPSITTGTTSLIRWAFDTSAASPVAVTLDPS